MSAVQQLLTVLAAHVQTKPAEFGSLRIRTDDATLRRHSRDKSYHHESQRPRAVVAVASEAHVALVLSLANALKVPVVAYAAGTSLEAQATLIDHNGIILDVSEMDNVVAVHEQDLSELDKGRLVELGHLVGRGGKTVENADFVGAFKVIIEEVLYFVSWFVAEGTRECDRLN
ncbi:hypothetical protein HDU81_006464 [Chytriomyces hyalinus]|nr:hypothetical protein HDU81_006464 [Chytriomyces hyalinus]